MRTFKFLMPFFILFIGHAAISKTPGTAIGVRGGFINALTVKHAISGPDALEVIVGLHYHGLNATALFERHKNFDDERFRWFYGLGGHVGIYDGSSSQFNNFEGTGIGVDGIIGLEFNFASIPINLTLDYKPVINLIGTSGYTNGAALSIRYVL